MAGWGIRKKRRRNDLLNWDLAWVYRQSCGPSTLWVSLVTFLMTAARVQEAPARGSSLDLPASLQRRRFSHPPRGSSGSVNPHSVFSGLLFSSYYLWSWLSQLVVNGSKWGQPWFPSLPLPFNQWGRRALLGRPRVYRVRTIHVRQALCTPGGSLSIKR